ncbi:10 TM domain-containing transmembrane protein [Acrasis kona]|uniref:10 TM domain-containing transmembrane protein n=1 Tax=Acrasis kona TaxID=1008807 RepID=A0AAW2YHG5_9EUKA
MKRALKAYYKLIFVRKDFRWVWFAYIANNFGQFFTNVSMLAVIEHTFLGYPNSGLAVSGWFLSASVPAMVLMPVTGVIVDMIDHRKTMFTIDVLKTFLVFSFALSLLNLNRFYWVIYVTQGLMSMLDSIYTSCREGLVPLVVPNEELVVESALRGLTWMLCAFAGGSLAGLLSSNVGAVACLTVNSALYCTSAAIIFQLFKSKKLSKLEAERGKKKKEDVLDTPMEEAQDKLLVVPDERRPKTLFQRVKSTVRKIPYHFLNVSKEFWLGAKFLILHPYILSLLFIKCSAALNYSAFDFVMTRNCFSVFVKNGQVESGQRAYGFYRSVYGVSSGLCPALVEGFLPHKYTGRTVRFVILLFFCIMIPAFGITVFLPENIYAYFVTAFIIACCDGTIWILELSSLQRVCAYNFLGRAVTFDFFNLNVINTSIQLIYGSIYYDKLRLNPKTFAFIHVGTASACSIYFLLWFVLTRKVEHERVVVDDHGNDAVVEQRKLVK